MNNLYTSDGWLNFDYIGSRPAWLIIILGARQVGKTYGCLQYMLKNNIYHILFITYSSETVTLDNVSVLNPPTLLSTIVTSLSSSLLLRSL